MDSKPNSSHLRATETGSSVISDSSASIPIFIGSSYARESFGDVVYLDSRCVCYDLQIAPSKIA
jgi:hypothetical protein